MVFSLKGLIQHFVGILFIIPVFSVIRLRYFIVVPSGAIRGDGRDSQLKKKICLFPYQPRSPVLPPPVETPLSSFHGLPAKVNFSY